MGMPPASGQDWSAKLYAEKAGFVAEQGRPLIELLAPQTGERILDLGCGDGTLSAAIQATGAKLVGVDSAADMIAAAKAKGIDAHLMDGRRLPFSVEFDAVFTNAALHWMRPLESVLSGVRLALKPGGRFVGEFGGHGNVAAIVVALNSVLAAHGAAPPRPAPWIFPSAEGFAATLAAAGFSVRRCELVPRPTLLEAGMEGWLTVFGAPYLRRLPDALRPAAAAEAEARLEPVLKDDRGRWWADYVRLRFAAAVR